MIKLTERMERIVGLVPKAEVVADVGCDHGKVGAALLLRGRAEKEGEEYCRRIRTHGQSGVFRSGRLG